MMDVPDLDHDPRAVRLCKRPLEISVMFATADGVCPTLEGPVRYGLGDALLTGVRGERWPVQRELFLASYQPILPTSAGQDGIYQKRPSITLAVRLDQGITVPVGWQKDPLHGHPGDWLLHYEDGSYGIVQDAILRETYEPAPGETRWP